MQWCRLCNIDPVGVAAASSSIVNANAVGKTLRDQFLDAFYCMKRQRREEHMTEYVN